MRAHLTNASYGVLDYLAYPLGMLAVAPIALRALGMDRYGIWMVATAAISTGAVLASGFGDANIRTVATEEATGDRDAVIAAVRTTLGIHVALGTIMALVGWLVAPWLTDRVVAGHSELRPDCLWSLRLASILMLLRAVETVCVSTQRAFARYGTALGVSLMARIGSLAAACILPFFSRSVSNILVCAALLTGAGVWVQFNQLKKLLRVERLLPRLEPATTRVLLSFGIFTWMQAAAGLLFGQVDRLIAGAAFGAAAVSSYGFCAQLSQPIYGVAAAGLHFLFPYLTRQKAIGGSAGVRRGVAIAFTANLLFVSFGLLGLLLFGNQVLRIWGGDAIAEDGARLLPAIASSAALSALSVTGTYSMLALGHVRMVTLLNVIGGLVMLCSTHWLLPRFGLEGMGYARLLYGPFALMVYIPLVVVLMRDSRPLVVETNPAACEEA
jgi:O-antigen/teichoic acid export membrane protein